MGTTLQHGIFLPAEGERNCYAGLASNWTILDGVVGGYSSHAANLTIHVTAADKEAWNGKADASALTAHTGNTTIHVTAEDKQAWDGHVADSVKHVTAEDKAKWDAVTSKANDSDVVHKSGNETINGIKTFSNYVRINRSSPSLQMKSTTYSSETSSAMTIGEISLLNDNGSFSAWIVHQLRNDLTKRLCFRVYPHDNSAYKGLVFDDSCNLYPENSNSALGIPTQKWKTLNGVEPSSLSLPSGNLNDIIDISSYLVNLDGTANTYTAPANGWISITMSNCSGIQAYIDGLWGHQIVRPTVGVVRFFMPVLKNKTVNILIFGGTIDNARFIPCQGNA